jgi:hypothetical protein
MVLGLTQPLAEMSTRNFVGCQGGRPVHVADNLPTMYEMILSKKVGAFMLHNPIGLIHWILLYH